jgi:hypothetical protein
VDHVRTAEYLKEVGDSKIRTQPSGSPSGTYMEKGSSIDLESDSAWHTHLMLNSLAENKFLGLNLDESEHEMNVTEFESDGGPSQVRLWS